MLNCKYGSPVEIIVSCSICLFCPHVKYYDKVVDWDMMKLVCIAGYFINFSFNIPVLGRALSACDNFNRRTQAAV